MIHKNKEHFFNSIRLELEFTQQKKNSLKFKRLYYLKAHF